MSTKLIDKVKEFRQMLQEQGEAGIKELFADFFAKFPSVAAVKWTQYAPYFNDGEPCVFSVNELEVKLTDEEASVDQTGDSESDDSDENDEEDDDEFIDSWDLDDEEDAALKLALNQLHEDMQILEDVFEFTFGSDQEVVIRRDGTVENEEYDHD